MKKSNAAATNLIAVIFTIIIVLVAWKLIIPSYVSNSAKLKSLDSEISAAQTKLDSLDTARSDMSSLQKAYDSISVAVPNNNDEPNLITELEAIALSNGIVLPTISISASDAAGSGATADSAVVDTVSGTTTAVSISISISVNGTYDQLTAFIAALEKSVKFMNIKSMNFADDPDNGLSLSLQLESYSVPTKEDANTSINDGSVSGVYSESGEPL